MADFLLRLVILLVVVGLVVWDIGRERRGLHTGARTPRVHMEARKRSGG